MCTCHRCLQAYDVDVIVDDEAWAEIRPNKLDNGDDESGLLCPECILDELKHMVMCGKFQRIEMKVL
jgi:hypothetical protein